MRQKSICAHVPAYTNFKWGWSGRARWKSERYSGESLKEVKEEDIYPGQEVAIQHCVGSSRAPEAGMEPPRVTHSPKRTGVWIVSGCVLMNFALTQKWHGKPPKVLGREMIWSDLYFNWISPAASLRLDCGWASAETGRPVKWLLLTPKHEMRSAVEVMKSGWFGRYFQGLAGIIRCRIWEMKWRHGWCPGFWLESPQSWGEMGQISGGAARARCHSALNALSLRCLLHVHVEMSQAVGNMNLAERSRIEIWELSGL